MQEQVESVSILSAIANLQSAQEYQELHWEGSLEDYLKLIQDSPRVTRNAFQRIYDMILSYGIEEHVEHKKKITRYRFFRDELPCPMREEPLHLIPADQREKLIDELMRNSRDPKFPIQVEGDLCPACRQMYRELTRRYKGDWFKVMDHVKVRRLVLAEKDRIGIGTFQPKDEKNQDSTELTGDINYRKIAIYGSDSDARAFNFDGEFNVANRGIIEFIEVLKLEVAFLYDLLGASQEHKIKPKKFPQTDIDEVIIGHTNEPEYRKLQNNEFMEALRDRTVKIDIPYITKLTDEIKVYEKDYN